MSRFEITVVAGADTQEEADAVRAAMEDAACRANGELDSSKVDDTWDGIELELIEAGS